jgi:hypothetical protein
MKRLALCCFLIAGVASGATIPGLYNTGQGLGDGMFDPHWQILSPLQQAVTVNAASLPGTWLANTADSRWVWQSSNGQPINVTRTFRTTFDLTGYDPSTAAIWGRWATDNDGLNILLNGNGTGQTSPGFGSWTSFSLSGGFIAGVNTLDFVVYDYGSIAGFRSEFQASSVDAVPEPGTIALVALGLGAVAFARRARRRA